MSAPSITLGSALAAVGISAATPGQLTTLRNTLEQTAATKANATGTQGSKEKTPGEQALSPAERRRIAELERIDAEVRAHEQAHITLGRGLITSGPSYTYTYGPDGKQYAVAGEVGIDTAPEREPQANIDKGQRIQDAALAPADPSPQDHSVAATGRRLEEQGRNALRAERQSQAATSDESPRDARLQAYTDAPEQRRQLDVYI